MAIIREFFAQLPCFIDESTRTEAEAKLAEVAAAYRPDELKRFADWYATVLNPDGDFSDEYRARKRGITSAGKAKTACRRSRAGWTPSCAPAWTRCWPSGRHPACATPATRQPTVEGEPSQEAIDDDDRSTAQRNHDALNAMVRNTLMSGELGSHQGLPVTITATVALADLQAKAGIATTGGGTLLPVTTLLRMAAHAYNFLLIFDDAKRCELYKGRSTRLATPAQRLVLLRARAGLHASRLRRARLLVRSAPRHQGLGRRRPHRHR